MLLFFGRAWMNAKLHLNWRHSELRRYIESRPAPESMKVSNRRGYAREITDLPVGGKVKHAGRVRQPLVTGHPRRRYFWRDRLSLPRRRRSVVPCDQNFPAAFVNPITFGGLAIAAVSLIVIVFLAVLEYFAESPNPYMGILAFVIVPSVLLSGLAIAAFGVWREHRSAAKRPPGRASPADHRPQQPEAPHRAGGGVHRLARPHLDVELRQLQGVRAHGVGQLLRAELPHGDGAGVHPVRQLAARQGGMRAVPHRLGSGLVRPVEALEKLPALRRAL